MEGGSGDVDVVAVMLTPGGACVHLISVRGGRVLGSKNFFPQVAIEEEGGDVLMAFLAQYYLGNVERDLPSELIVNVQHEDFATLVEAIAVSYTHLDVYKRQLLVCAQLEHAIVEKQHADGQVEGAAGQGDVQCLARAGAAPGRLAADDQQRLAHSVASEADQAVGLLRRFMQLAEAGKLPRGCLLYTSRCV